jgi:hypothetical protein
VISPTPTTLPESTLLSQETDIHAPAGFEPTIPESKPPKTRTLERAATGIGLIIIIIIIRESSSEREMEESGKAHEAVTAPCFERLTQ